MALPELIKYRDLANQLSPQETQQLMRQFSEHHGQLILSALFMHLRTTMNSDPEGTQQVLDDLNQCISSIVEGRENDTPNDDEAITPKKLCDLPKALIGLTASFLDQKSYARFSGACRSIYLGCNAPNQLQSLDVRHLESDTVDTFIDLRRFASTKCFKFTSTQFNRLTASIDGIVMDRLEHVVIDGKDSIDGVLADTHIAMVNVTTLECLNMCSLQSAQYARLRSKFPNVKHLNLVDLSTTALNFASVTDSFASQYSDLRGLAVSVWTLRDGWIDMAPLLRVVGDRLEYFKLSTHCDLSGVKFSRLRQLSLSAYHGRSHQTITEILKTAAHLRKAKIEMSGSPQTRVSTEGIVQFFTRCEQLEYLDIEVAGTGPYSAFEWILECIEKGLFETLSLKRNSLKIRIRTESDGYDHKPLAMKVLRTIHLLQMRNIQDFMLILEADKNALDTIADLPDNDVLLNRTEGKLVISNANCRICGYQEQWMNPLM